MRPSVHDLVRRPAPTTRKLLIGRTLAAIHAAAREVGRALRVIVVDDGSTDATAAMARRGGARACHVHYRQIGRTRNAGARVAAGEILIFVDADTLSSASTLVPTLRALDAGAVGGGASLRLEGEFRGTAGCCWCWSARGMRLGGLAAGCYVFCTPRRVRGGGRIRREVCSPARRSRSAARWHDRAASSSFERPS